ncbi:MAG: asparagine synthase (glutamine-hydrolyzing) [Planctomycetes bacterium]|nr:asparagine synthase (glutamine-hydrolyzing) [Planctomycetota bacterium]
MCGVAGFLDPSGRVRDPRAVLDRMSSALQHRGPDDSGLWWQPPLPLGLAHRRLAVIDPTPAGHQPMASASGRWVIAWNGEVYNAPEIRAELERAANCSWRGHSDTEVMLASLDAWGIERSIDRWRGMFAGAVVDLHLRVLHLIRDGAGKKPMVWGWIDGVLSFASEFRALRSMGLAMPRVHDGAVAAFLRYGSVPGEQTILQGIFRVPPGALLSWAIDGAVGAQPQRLDWWNALRVARACEADPLPSDPAEMPRQLQERIDAAVGRRLRSDVPLGVCLSGGIDSALIAASAARLSGAAIHTFTLGFDVEGYDERAAAQSTARAIGSKHALRIVSDADVIAAASRLADVHDEPLADSSQIAGLLLSEFVRGSVTVALSGDGGDEVLGGYERCAAIASWWSARLGGRGWLPKLQAAQARYLLPPLLPLLRSMPQLLGRGRVTRPLEKLDRVRALVRSESLEEAIDALASVGLESGSLLAKPASPLQRAHDSDGAVTTGGLLRRILREEFAGPLIDDLLVKVDRTSMSVALEVRSPFLDRDLVEWAWRMPIEAKVRYGHKQRSFTCKWAARELARSIAPKVADLPKMGFGVPIAAWLRGPLRPWAESLLSRSAVSRAGLMHADSVHRLWQQLLAGDDAPRHQVWAVLMLQAWSERWR